MFVRVLFAGGGTAGHINPALAIAGYLREKQPDAEILFIGNRGGMEEKLVPKAGFAMKTIVISGFQRKMTPKAIAHNVKTLTRVVTSSHQARRIIREFAPDLCVGTGGYVSGPVVRTAMKLGIPAVIHEQNAYPGVTNKMLSADAARVMMAVSDAEKYMKPGARCVLTGNPIRPEILREERAAARKKLGVDDRPLILSFGGSLGARKVNEAVADLMTHTIPGGKFQHIHGYGQYSRWMPDLLREKGIDPDKTPQLDLREYIHDMPVCLAAADLVISRAGAMTLSEIQATGKGSILIPSPNVAENHQFHNAMALVNRGAAEIVEEKDLTGDVLWEKVQKIFAAPGGAAALGENAAKMAIRDANERIYRVMMEVLQEKRA
ncbi:MAG: undecaprenyldiphospho-muramoylpentapeptide beta-N-acetylglucosaminyltransferase [Candidatus Heritagella sp.]|nr:undecaprenyldiphospho-muramoylpentapeptide beta-N-acetylglucosaminyltransferase [Candidatus Heritagella sp.]